MLPSAHPESAVLRESASFGDAAPFGVLFDIDDTLIDFAGAARLALLDVASVLGGSPDAVLASWEVVSEREYQRFLVGEVGFEKMLVDRMAAVLAQVDPAGVLEMQAAELERLRNESIFRHYRPYDDVKGCLARFAAGGIPVGVVSNSDGDYQRRKMAAAGLDELVAGAIFSGDLGVSKPDPRIFLAGAEMLGLPPARVVYVGDRWATDAAGALAAGLAAVWLNRLELPRPVEAQDEPFELCLVTGRLAELTDLDMLDVQLATRLVDGLGVSGAAGVRRRIGRGQVCR